MTAREAVVVETGRGWAIILLPHGKYERIKTSQYLEVGDLYQPKNPGKIKYLIAAAIFLTIVLGSIDYYTVQAYAEVSSLVELGVNRWGRVITVQAENNEGQQILDTVKIKNDKLETAVENISKVAMEEKHCVNLAIKKPTLTVTANDKTNKNLEQKMLEKMNRGLERAIRSKGKAIEIEGKRPIKKESNNNAIISKPEPQKQSVKEKEAAENRSINKGWEKPGQEVGQSQTGQNNQAGPPNNNREKRDPLDMELTSPKVDAGTKENEPAAPVLNNGPGGKNPNSAKSIKANIRMN